MDMLHVCARTAALTPLPSLSLGPARPSRNTISRLHVRVPFPQPRVQADRQAPPPQPRQKAGGVGTPKETHHDAQNSPTSTTQHHFTTMCPEGAPVTGA